jgi:4-amino-4-deoxy-L-arabinose transferase-like glycosyltransferase
MPAASKGFQDTTSTRVTHHLTTRWMKSHQSHIAIASWLAKPWLGLALVTLLAAALRFPSLHTIPPGFHYDEALEALEAWRVIIRPDYHPVFFPGDFGLPPMFIYLESLAFRLLPAVPEVSRGIAALIGVLTVPAVYVLGREMVLADERTPRSLPLLAAAVLAISRWHITFSRVAIEPILVPLFLTLILWAFLAALRTNRPAAWLGLGAALGLSVYTYPAAWLMLPMMGAILIYLLVVAPKRLAGRARGLGLAALIAVALAAPLAISFIQHPEQLALRSGQVAIVAPEQALQDMAKSLGGNLLKALGMFSVAGDTDPRSNIPGRPALDLLTAIPFYLGLILALRRWKQPAIGILLLAGGTMLFTTVFSQYAPHFRRVLGITPVIALLSGLGLATIWAFAARHLGVESRAEQALDAGTPAALAGKDRRGIARTRMLWGMVGAGLAIFILLGSAVWNIHDYFVIWGSSPELFYAYDEGLWQIGQYVTTLPKGEAVYISPRPIGDATLAFAWRAGPAVRHFDGRAAFVTQAAAGQTPTDATYVVIEHEDFRGTRLLKELYPNAEEVKTFLDREGRVYARAFRVPAGSTLAHGPDDVTRTRWRGISLWGYNLNEAVYHPGEIVYLQLWWRATTQLSTNWTVFTHLLGPPKEDGSILWAGNDAPPGQGSVPTTTLAPNELVLDEHQIQLPADMPPGEYEIEVGLYDPVDDNARAISRQPRGEDAIILGKVVVQ